MKKILIALCFLSSVTCSGSGPSLLFSNENKPIYKSSLCVPDNPMPQMILIPFFDKASQVVPNCDTYPKHMTALAMMVFYHKWDEYFGDSDYAVRGMLQRVMIQWDTNKKIGKKGFSINGEAYTKRIIIGKVHTKNIIWVWQGYNHKISESALMHELVHLALYTKNGSPDADHEGSKYRGWTYAHSLMIDDAKDMLRAFNL